MKYLSLALALLTLPLCAEEQKFTSNTPAAQNARWTKKWWMPRHEAKLEEKKALGNVQLVFIGDSITHEWDRKAKHLWNKEFGRYNALNLGFDGDQTQHVLWRLQNGEIDGIKPKVIVLMIGTNNVGARNEPSEQTAAGIKAILDLLEDKQPQAKVILLGIFPRGATTDDPKRKLNDATNEIIKTYADNKRVYYLNINDKFLKPNGDLSRMVMPDLLHPAPKQYQVWADALRPDLNKLMK